MRYVVAVIFSMVFVGCFSQARAHELGSYRRHPPVVGVWRPYSYGYPYVAPPPISGPGAVVHQNGILDYVGKVISVPFVIVLGRDRLRCAPDDVACQKYVGHAEGHYEGRVETADKAYDDAYKESYVRAAPPENTQRIEESDVAFLNREPPPPPGGRMKSHEPTPPKGWREEHPDEGSLPNEKPWEIKIIPDRLSVLGRKLDDVRATEDERAAFEQAVLARTPTGKEITLSPDQITLLESLRKKFDGIPEVDELDKLIALAKFARQEKEGY